MTRWVTASEIAERYPKTTKKRRMKSARIRPATPFFRILFPSIPQIRDDKDVIQILNARSAYDRDHVEWMFDNYRQISRHKLPTIFPCHP